MNELSLLWDFTSQALHVVFLFLPFQPSKCLLISQRLLPAPSWNSFPAGLQTHPH